ncbi:MAG: phosphoenolpyruvate carboxylase [Lachnospiraceae bacterium]|nr:phosphoenolpyruvate carboxylase [Lachnospiraceae bacterium]
MVNEKLDVGHGVPDPLQADIHLLGGLLGKILKESGGQGLLDDVEKLRSLTVQAYKEDLRSWEHGGDGIALAEAEALVETFTVERAHQVTRAFTTYFHLANLAEEFHRVRLLRRIAADNADFDPAVDESIPAAFTQLTKEVGREEAIRRLNEMEFRPVLTAHPTEARRRSVSRAVRRITDLLSTRDTINPAGTAGAELERVLLAEIDILWRTAPLRPAKPTVIDEVKMVMDVFESTMFDALPDVYRRLDDWILGEEAGYSKPVVFPFVKMGSWIGGDRDGNPNATSEVTLQAASTASQHILTALEGHAKYVARKITVSNNETPPSDDLMALWNRLWQMDPVCAAKISEESSGETHRSVLAMIAVRIAATRNRNADLAYPNAEKLEGDLATVQNSLLAAGAPRAAYGQLQRLIWQVNSFGFHLAELEMRQHSQVLMEALAEIEEKGINAKDLSERSKEVLDTFRALGSIQARYGIRAARRFIVSFTQTAEHLSAVYKLAEYAFPDKDERPVIDAIPLFETFADLEGSVEILEKVLEIPQVQKRLSENGRRIEVMLGYSDSSKDVGPVSATISLHSAQARITKWAKGHKLVLTLFHGRGGSLGRGGGPANRALLAQPAGSVDGRFKLTEQGEVIQARYGDPTIATNHIEQVASAILMAGAPSIEKRNIETTAKYADLAKALDQVSREKFLVLVRTEGFPTWFAQVTPLEELGLLTIGSRPAKRGLSVNSLADLRAIPWVFSWSQSRINLAGWYGLGTALQTFAESREDGLQILQIAFQEWPLFNTMLDNVEMSLAKIDERIGKMYLRLGDRDELAELVLEELRATRKWVLRVTGARWPLETRRVLGRAVQLRAPYVDALSLLQVRALRALRKEADESNREDWQQLLLLTVNGVSAGLQNTG